MSEGIVYILTNAAMPGFIKIGLTQQDDVSTRLKGLDNTSLPLPFECYSQPACLIAGNWSARCISCSVKSEPD